jgi:hypothetical protein
MSGLYCKSPSKKNAKTMKKIFKKIFSDLPTLIFSHYETGTTGIFFTPNSWLGIKKNTCGSGSRPTLFFSADPITFSTRLTVSDPIFSRWLLAAHDSMPKWRLLSH